MKLWHGIFIMTFVIFYGALGVALLGSWLYETTRSLMRAHRPSSKPLLREDWKGISPTSWISIRGLLRH